MSAPGAAMASDRYPVSAGETPQPRPPATALPAAPTVVHTSYKGCTHRSTHRCSSPAASLLHFPPRITSMPLSHPRRRQ